MYVHVHTYTDFLFIKVFLSFYIKKDHIDEKIL